jgi:hypothetical protein
VKIARVGLSLTVTDLTPRVGSKDQGCDGGRSRTPSGLASMEADVGCAGSSAKVVGICEEEDPAGIPLAEAA